MFSINTFAFVHLAALWTCYVQGYVLSSSNPVITPAPANYALIQERQNGVVTCSEWTIPNGGGYVECPASETCVVDEERPYAACAPASAQEVPFIFSCYDYPSTPTTVAVLNDLICSVDAPDCGTMIFVSGVYSYYNYGCSTVAYEITAEFDMFTAAASTTTNPFGPVSTSTPTATQQLSSSAASSSPSTASSSVASTGSTSSSTSSSKSNAAVIGGAVGGAVGGLVVIVAVILALICVRRRKRNRQTLQQPQATAPGTQHHSRPDEKKQPFVTAAAPQDTAPEEKSTKPYVSPNC